MHPPANPNHHHLQYPHFLPQPPPQQPDLDATLSTLKTLITLSTQTLTSLTQNYQIPLPQNDHLTPCPFNNHHRIPPESLFSHSLKCPSPLLIEPSTSPSCPYRDCPGPVTFNNSPRGIMGNTIYKIVPSDIPSSLIDQCGGRGIMGIDGFRMLASEVWELRNEVAGWDGLPGRCSVNLVRAVIGVRLVSKAELKRWVIVNSTGYGVVIDGFVTDCVLVLLRLCFKAIVREAEELFRERDHSRSLVFECPVCVEVLSWLASRVSVLYGETNGRVFVLNVFKHVVLESASGMLLFGDGNESCDGFGDVEKSWEGEISVDQVGEAVDALYKRSLLEEKIRALRAPRSLSRYERYAEHTYLTSKAEEERGTRTNYRRIIDHDGLPRHYSSNQDSNKRKTREELLAEERDYKRRRMSYRGKKAKRSTLQVMRDIIEAYMDEIKQAGGIGCFEKGAEEECISQTVKPLEDVCMLGNLSKHREERHHGYGARHKGFGDDTAKDYDRQRRRSHSHSENWEGQSRYSGKHRADKVHHYGSPERSRSRGKSYSDSNHRIELDDIEATRKRHDKTKRVSPRRSKYQDDRSLVASSIRKGEKKMETGKQRNRHGNHHSDYIIHEEFPDRYDPSESHDLQEDYVYTGRSCDGADKL